MPAESCVSPFLTYPRHQQQHGNLHRQRLPLEQMHFMISESNNGIKQEREDSNGAISGGEDKDFPEKWQQIGGERNTKDSPSDLDDTEPSNHQLHYHHHQLDHHFQSQHQVPDEVNLDSQDNSEGSNTPSAGKGSASSSCPASASKDSSSFLFVGPLGKKRKYSRQRAASDDNESESHLPIAAGSPDTAEEEMDQSQSPSPDENSESSRKNSGTQEQFSLGENSNSELGMAGGEPVSTIVRPSSTQRSTASSDSGGDSAGEPPGPGNAAGGGGASTVISKPSPIIGAPTSVIRRVNRKKQEHPLPLNLSVSSPPGNSSSNFSSSSDSSNLVIGSPAGRASTLSRAGDDHGPTTNPSVIRDELYFDGRTQGDRQVFVWRYRDDVPPATTLATGVSPMSPSLSTISATSFVVPDVTGSKLGSSGASSSASSTISQLPSLSQNPNLKRNDGASVSGSNTSGKPPKKKLRCGDCGKEFSQLRNYRYHMSRHEGSDQFSCTCPVCGKQFNDRGYLSSHMKIHRNAKEYRCEYCTKGFNQRVAYNMHRRIHTGHRPHQCEVCGKSFSRRMLLKQHMRIHTGERPYSCGVCNKAFADRSNMLLHQRLHSGERPYVCEICKKSFSKNHHLKTHMNHHAGIKPYECPKCHARFSQSSNMKTHLKKCSGVPNPTTSQRQHMLRRNPLDIGRSTAQLPPLPSLPSVVAAAAAAAAAAGNPNIRGSESLPPLSGASRLLYEQQSLSLLTQSISGGQGVASGPSTVPQMSPAHSRGQVPIESLLLHLNVSRSRHPSQSSVHSGPQVSPTSSVSLSDFQLMLRNAAAAAAVSSGSRSISSNQGSRIYSNSPPLSSSMSIPSATVTTSGMTSISGLTNFGGMILSQSPNSRHSPPGNANANDPMATINPSLGLVGYGSRSGGHIDSTSMPPPQSNGSSVLRNIPTPSSFMHHDLLPPSPGSVLRIDTRSMDTFSSGVSPTERSGARQIPNPLVSPRRKQPSPSSLSASGSLIPLSTLETAAIASGLRSPSQMVKFLSSALRDAESPLQPSSQSGSSGRLPSLQHQNVLEAMVAAAAAEQNVAASSPSPGGSTRIRQVPSPHLHHHTQSHSFQYSENQATLPSLHLQNQSPIGSGGPHHSSLTNPLQPQQIVSPPPSYSVITSSHSLQQQEQHHQQMSIQRAALNYPRYASAPSTSSASRQISAMEEHHAASDQHQHIELQHQQIQRQHGYHQTLLQRSVNQGVVSSPGYSTSPSNTGSSSGYSAFNHSSISRSRSHSPGTIDHIRERNHDYQNQ